MPIESKLDRVAGVDVLGEDKDADRRVGFRIAFAARRPSSVWVGGMRMSTIATSGSVPVDELEKLLGVRGHADDFEPRLLEQPGQPLSKDHRVVADRYAHGIAARSRVPRPGGSTP